jgi:hypothetical protein
MHRFTVAAAVVLLAACAPARVKQVATQPAPSVSSPCPLFVIDGVVQEPSECVAPKTEKVATPKCDPTAPLYVVDGVVQGQPCAKPPADDFLASMNFVPRKSK